MTRRRRDDLAFIVAQRRRKRTRAGRIRRRRRAGVVLAALAVGAAAFFAAGGIGAGIALTGGCSLSSLRPVQIGQNSFVYARDGSLLGSIPAVRNRQPVAFGRMSKWLPIATVAVEDRRYYHHGGLDYQGILRAAWADVTTGKPVQGGSTITQQLVRNLYVGQEKTLGRKLREACLAIKLADRWSKQRILTDYLNTVYYGNHAYGVQAAAETYFSKPASQLTLLEAALIAGLPQAPSEYDPLHDPQAARQRRGEVLQALYTNHDIDRRTYEAAARTRSLELRPGRAYTSIKEPYFFSYVLDELSDKYGANTVREGGLKVYTTIDPRLQRLARKAIDDILPYKTDPAAAIVSVQPGTGAIRAMTAVTRRSGDQFNLAAQSARQAGSTFKTFVLASAIEQGMDPSSTYYTSAPFTCTVGPWCRTPWSVHTYGNTYAGTESVTQATLQSDNTIYAQLTLDVGPAYVWSFAHRLGVQMSPDKPVASIGLGSLGVSPLDMAAAYATFAAMGVYAKPMAITKVIFPDGKVDTASGWGKPEAKRAVSQGVAWEVNNVLGENASYGTGAGSGDGVHPNAGKTGTTDSYADAWFDGYTRQLSTVVWMGYPQGEIPMTDVHGVAVAGATFPVPIWHEYMAAALWHRPALAFPTPNAYPTFRPFTKGYWGSLAYIAPPVQSTTTTATTTTTPAKPSKPARPASRSSRSNRPG